jgi:hypothetical protein
MILSLPEPVMSKCKPITIDNEGIFIIELIGFDSHVAFGHWITTAQKGSGWKAIRFSALSES